MRIRRKRTAKGRRREQLESAVFVLNGTIFEARDDMQKKRLAGLPMEHKEPVIRETIATLAYFEMGLGLGGLAKWANDHGVPLQEQQMEKVYEDVEGYRRALHILGVTDIDARRKEMGL
jgi:hypothetical protein